MKRAHTTVSKRRVSIALGLAAAFVATGCQSKAADAGDVSKASGQPMILHAGGTQDDVTSTFSTKTASVRIDFQLSQASARPDATFTIEQDGGGGMFSPVSTVTKPLVGLQGTFSVSLLPGAYRIRVATDVPWSVDVYEAKG